MQKIFSYNNVIIEYEDIGTGEIIILLHGFAEDATIWKNQVAFLQLHYRLILPNILGTQQSSMLHNNEASIDNYATFIYYLILNLNLPESQQVSMFGHSMGGYITLAFAKMYSTKLKCFGLINSTAYADTLERKEIRQRAKETMQEYGVDHFLKATIPNLFTTSFKDKHPDIIAELCTSTFRIETLQQYYTIMADRADRTDVLQEFGKPILFIVGKEDKIISVKDIVHQSSLPQIAHLVVLENTAHMAMLEEPDAVNKSILRFMQLL